ncbi:WW domain binding protein 11, partial [Multifurca ochricompacta]
MAKGKNLNPADAYRKVQRKKELKKNRAERQKTRDFALVKKDTGDLEDEIKKLSSAPSLSDADQKRLKDLKA